MFKLAIWLVFIFSVSFAYRVKRDANEGSVEKKNGETDALKEKILFETVKNGTTEIINSLFKKMEDANAEMHIRSIIQKNADAGKVNNNLTEIIKSREPKTKDVELSYTQLNSSVLEDVYAYVYYICPRKLEDLQLDLDDLKKEPYADLYEKVKIDLNNITISLDQKLEELSSLMSYLGFGRMVNEMRVLAKDLNALEEDLNDLNDLKEEKPASALDIKQTQLSKEQSGYLGLPVDGPYKPDHYRY